MTNTRGKVQGRKIMDNPAKNAKETPGMIWGEVNKLNKPVMITESKEKPMSVKIIFVLLFTDFSIHALFLSCHYLS